MGRKSPGRAMLRAPSVLIIINNNRDRTKDLQTSVISQHFDMAIIMVVVVFVVKVIIVLTPI